jgi:hypothetical protein
VVNLAIVVARVDCGSCGSMTRVPMDLWWLAADVRVRRRFTELVV